MSTSPVDLLIIGGGINGTGIACDAAGRGLSVHLCEQNDLASGTSSKSSKLIHGGLRYLEYYEFRLVHEALIEREVLLRKAPHLIKPLEFVLPYHPGLRPAWLIRLGLWLYDHLGKRTLLPSSKSIRFPGTLVGAPLQARYTQGFTYADCWTDDARLVIANALEAKEKGAQISPYCKVVKLLRAGEYWQATLLNQLTQESFTVSARAVVNATGPWIQEFFTDIAKMQSHHHLRMVKGSHIIVPALYQGDHAYILQQTDGRIVFAIPYQTHWTLIGTTDVDYQGEPSDAQISPEEMDYLCQVINDYFKLAIDKTQIVSSFSGIRPLFDNNQQGKAQSLSRDYAFELTDEHGHMPLLSIFGGKITTYRKLAEHALTQLTPYFPQMGTAWTRDAYLPGGNIPNADFDGFCQQLYQAFPALPQDLLYRYARLYGTRAYVLLTNVSQPSDLGEHFGADCYQLEIEYLRNHEWGHHLDDILYRRTKLFLQLTEAQLLRLKAWWANQGCNSGTIFV